MSSIEIFSSTAPSDQPYFWRIGGTCCTCGPLDPHLTVAQLATYLLERRIARGEQQTDGLNVFGRLEGASDSP